MRKKPLNFGRFALVALFISSCALILFLIVITFRNYQEMQADGKWVYHSTDVNSAIEKIYDQSAELQLLLVNNKNKIDDNYLNNFEKNINSDLTYLQRLVIDNPSQTAKAKAYRSNVELYVQNVHKLLTSGLKANYAEHYLQKVRESRDALAKSENILLIERRGKLSSSMSSLPVFIYLLSVFSLIIISYSFYELNKEYKKQKIKNRELRLARNTSELAEKLGNYGVWRYNSLTKRLDISKNLAKLFETDSLHILPDDEFWSRVNKNDAKRLLAVMDKINAGDSSPQITYRFLRKDGTYRHMHTGAISVPADDSGVTLIGVSADISEIVNDKSNLKAANDQLNFYNESSRISEIIGNYGFWRWNSKTGSFWFSDNLYKIFGIDSSDAVSEFMSTVHPDDRDMVQRKVNAMYAGIHSDNFEHRIYRKNDGELRNLFIRSTKIEKSKDESLFIIITQDITDQKIQQKTIEEKNLKLEEANQELTAFNYIASHDLQEPLRKIEIFSSRISFPDSDTSTNKTYFLKIGEMTRKMRSLITDLLRFSRTTKQDEAFQNTDLNEILQESIEDAKQKYENTQIEFHHEDLPTLSVIPFQIQQLFSNIILNSLKYRNENTPPEIEVECKTIQAEDEKLLQNSKYQTYCKITFKDNGIGFDNEYSEKIFDLFSRLHSGSEYEGTGIGLAICKKIMSNHNGFITASSQPGIGSQFHLYFPLS